MGRLCRQLEGKTLKLASLREGRDGRLVLVSGDLARMTAVPDLAPTLQAALDDWARAEPALRERWRALEAGRIAGAPFHARACAAPLPRAYHWADGSAYVTHVELVRRSRGAELPASFWSDPLIYQGGSDVLLGPEDEIRMADEAWGIDLEAEVAVVTDAVPAGVAATAAGRHIKLVMLANDVSLRNLIPAELAKSFGFYQSKPPTAFSPVAVTPDALGSVWDGGRLHLPLHAFVNGRRIGSPNAGVDMTFDFPTLIAHAAKTRPLGPGTIIGSGTVSNRDRSAGSCCIAEIRMLETLKAGKAQTPFLKFGDRVRIEMLDGAGRSIFGAIEQEVVRYAPPAA
jgi:fumarylacetoacetate (FAA) hydrolase